MSRKVYLTTAEAIADVEELSDVDDNQIDVVIAPPETSVVSDEEGLDENDLAENELSLPDAAGMIEVHQTISEKLSTVRKVHRNRHPRDQSLTPNPGVQNLKILQKDGATNVQHSLLLLLAKKQKSWK